MKPRRGRTQVLALSGADFGIQLFFLYVLYGETRLPGRLARGRASVLGLQVSRTKPFQSQYSMIVA